MMFGTDFDVPILHLPALAASGLQVPNWFAPFSGKAGQSIKTNKMLCEKMNPPEFMLYLRRLSLAGLH